MEPIWNWCLSYDNVRRGSEDGDSGDDSEGGEGDEAEPVEHHGRKLPVVLNGGSVFVVP